MDRSRDTRWVIGEMKQGHCEAFAHLYSRYESKLVGFVKRCARAIGRLGVDIEDVIQDTWTVIFRKITGFDRRSEWAFESWMKKIAKVQLHMAVRSSVRRGVRVGLLHLDEGAEPAAPAEPTPSESPAPADLLLGLSDSDREILTLRYVEGLDTPALAARLGSSEAAIHQCLHRARERAKARALAAIGAN
jgi:RNA polymerase sigma-70 factor (ECF subfamily)